MINRITLIILLPALFAACFMSGVMAAATSDESLSRANDYLEQGQYFLALQEADSALQHAASKTQQSRAYGIKGNVLLIMQRYDEAEKTLLRAYDLAEQVQRKAGYANNLGVLYHEMGDKHRSVQYFKVALELAGNDSALALKIKMNQLRVQPELAKLPVLNALLTEIFAVGAPNERVKYALNLAAIAKSLDAQALTVAQHALEKAQADSTSHLIDKQLHVEVLDSLAALYEKQGQDMRSLALSEQASSMAGQMDVDDLMIDIEWRKGRIYQRLGRDDEALSAFRKAVDHIQAIRRDIPVTYKDGKSSFREKLEPVYLGYAHHLLKKAGHLEEETRQRTLFITRQTIEQIKQTELEDFLGGRCLIEGLQRSELESIDRHAAILYPIILPDRLELLVSIGKTIHQYTIPVRADDVHSAAYSLSDYLRKWILFPDEVTDANDYRQSSMVLYQWIIAPIEKDLVSKSIKTLVVVPDGVLRLVPFSALFDGKRYLIEKYAVSISPGMSPMGGEIDQSRTYRTLLAGLSKPGPVVEKLPAPIINALLQPDLSNTPQQNLPGVRGALSKHLRSMGKSIKYETDPDSGNVLRQPGAIQKLQEELSLPGVELELNNLQKTLKNTTLLNEQFTTGSFYQQVSGGSYEIVHIASHAVFSSEADSSFLLAYDDVLKLDDLNVLLKSDNNASQRIHLLTLSACETAEGDDRAPLGFTGAALKADAHSALGSLWPISDEAASFLMTHFYKNLTQHLGKAESLRQAQLELLRSVDMSHPSFWSTFILVGNWL